MPRNACCFGLLLLTSLLPPAAPGWAQTPITSPQTPAPSPAKTDLLPAEEITQEEAFARMKELNDAKKLISTMFGPARYKALEQENCHGLRFRDGTRLLWESLGKYYNLRMETISAASQKTYEAIGIVYAETDFRLGDKVFEKGPYMVYASPEELFLHTWEGKKDSGVFAFQNKLDPTAFDAKADKAPRLAFVQTKEGLFLEVGKNSFPVFPQ